MKIRILVLIVSAKFLLSRTDITNAVCHEVTNARIKRANLEFYIKQQTFSTKSK